MSVFSHGFFAMNSRFAMVIPGIKSDLGDQLAKGAEKIVEHWEQCLSSYRPGAELQVINAHAAERKLVVSERLNGVLDICDHYQKKSKGLFDPAVNQNKSAWKEVSRDYEKATIHFSHPGVKLDMGGIGKGFALEEVVLYLRQEEVKDAFLSFGESSLAGMGNHPHGDGWLIGNPEAFLLKDDFLSVSGLQAKGNAGDDDPIAHIYHPLRGELVGTKRRVMVQCKSAVEAEVLSTCAYMASNAEFEDLQGQFPEAVWKVD